MFFVRPQNFSTEAKRQAAQYFAQGHEVNFIEIKNWILMCLATMGRKGRDAFNRKLFDLMSDQLMPSAMKAAWNQQIEQLVEI